MPFETDTTYTMICDHCQHRECVGDASNYNAKLDSGEWIGGTLQLSFVKDYQYQRGILLCSRYCLAKFMDQLKNRAMDSRG